MSNKVFPMWNRTIWVAKYQKGQLGSLTLISHYQIIWKDWNTLKKVWQVTTQLHLKCPNPFIIFHPSPWISTAFSPQPNGDGDGNGDGNGDCFDGEVDGGDVGWLWVTSKEGIYHTLQPFSLFFLLGFMGGTRRHFWKFYWLKL